MVMILFYWWEDFGKKGPGGRKSLRRSALYLFLQIP